MSFCFTVHFITAAILWSLGCCIYTVRILHIFTTTALQQRHNNPMIDWSVNSHPAAAVLQLAVPISFQGIWTKTAHTFPLISLQLKSLEHFCLMKDGDLEKLVDCGDRLCVWNPPWFSQIYPRRARAGSTSYEGFVNRAKRSCGVLGWGEMLTLPLSLRDCFHPAGERKGKGGMITSGKAISAFLFWERTGAFLISCSFFIISLVWERGGNVPISKGRALPAREFPKWCSCYDELGAGSGITPLQVELLKGSSDSQWGGYSLTAERCQLGEEPQKRVNGSDRNFP